MDINITLDAALNNQTQENAAEEYQHQLQNLQQQADTRSVASTVITVKSMAIINQLKTELE